MLIGKTDCAHPRGIRKNSDRERQTRRANLTITLALGASLVLAGPSSVLASSENEPDSDLAALDAPDFDTLSANLDQGARSAADRLVSEALTQAMRAVSTRQDRALATRADENRLAKR